MPIVARVRVLAFVLLAAGCATAAPNSATPETPPTVILISMDGTRPADLTRERLPELIRLAERGARAERLVPSLPSNTFPNHVSH